MSMAWDETSTAFLIDVDNTLLDNDRFAADLTEQLDHAFGKVGRERYWAIYGELRDRLGYADYLGALQAFRSDSHDEPALLQMSSYLLDYPFQARLYPQALDVLRRLGTLGHAVILSDGDIVYQPRKIQRSGLWEAVQGCVLVYVHKERMLDAVQRRFPARHYVMVDDKPQLLAAVKLVLTHRLTTVFVRQGHYANDPASADVEPLPDLTVSHIGDLLGLSLDDIEASGTLSSIASQEHP
jgi:FMN phosphatase YigB (HAD superfamily)